VIKVIRKEKARYFKTVMSPEGNLFKNKKKELPLLTELAPSNSLVPTFKINLEPPAVTEFIVRSVQTIAGAPISINRAISRGLVL
jgi:hypothetical protein